MCGISGFIYSNANYEQKKAIINSMLYTIKHRGPDDYGYFIDNWATIGMQRLSIIDLKHGHQPIFTDDKLYSIVFNGEIYNYKDLKRKLKKKGYIFRTNSDTEDVLAAYRIWGTMCLDELDGMFAFTIYDRAKRELFLARDPYGIKPLYYTQQPQFFAFASELKSLLKFPLFEKEINTEALHYYLLSQYVPAPMSIFKGIQKLMPGQYMIINEDGRFTKNYFTYSFRPKYRVKSEFDIQMKLKSMLENAVAKRMISDVPLGSFLSGGIDSSLVTAIMQKKAGAKKVNTFSIGFKEKSFDESHYAKQVARYLGTKHHHKVFTATDAIKVMPEIMLKLDEPFADASILPTFLLSQFTRKHVKVALSGDGADELFGGYPTYYAHTLADKYSSFLPYSMLKKLGKLLPVSDNNMSFDFKVNRFVKGLRFDADLRHQVWLGSFDNYELLKLMTPQYKIGHSAYDMPLLRNHMHHCDTEENWERALWQDMRFYLQDNMLVKIDRAAMFNSLEVRVPFLDKRLSQYVMHLPANLKYRGKISKYILKKLAKEYLPEEHIKSREFLIRIMWINWYMNIYARSKITDCLYGIY